MCILGSQSPLKPRVIPQATTMIGTWALVVFLSVENYLAPQTSAPWSMMNSWCWSGSGPSFLHVFVSHLRTLFGGSHQTWSFNSFVILSYFSRKRPRRVLSKKRCHWRASLRIVFKHRPKVLLKWWLSLKDCHQTSPKVLLKWWLSLKIVIKHRPKFYWSDGCLYSLSSNIAQSSTEVMAVFKDCHQTSPKVSTEVMAVFTACHQTSPKVLLKWWLSLKIVIMMAVLRDCHQTSPKVLLKWWLSLKRLSSNIAQSSTEVMAVFEDCHQTSPKVLLKWWLFERLEKRLLKVLLKWWLCEIQEKKTAEKKIANQNRLKKC